MKVFPRILTLCTLVLVTLGGCPDTTLPLIDQNPTQMEGLTGGVICTAEDVKPSDPSTFVVHFIDVGQGDGMWLRLPSGDPENPLDIVVDVGDGPNYPGDTTRDAGILMADYMEAHGMAPGSILDWLVVTHGDSDHFGGAPTLMSRFPARSFMGSGYLNTSDSWRDVRTDIQLQVGAVGGDFASPVATFAGADVALSTSLVDAEVLWGTTEPPGDNSNNSGVVLRFTVHGKSLLLTGDIDDDVEEALVAAHIRDEIDIKSHVLKVPHHGSDSSSSEVFLNAVFGGIDLSERRAVIQSGTREFNGARLPRAEIVDRLRTFLDEGSLLSTEHDDEGKSTSESAGDDHVVLTIAPGGRIHTCYNPGGLVQSGDEDSRQLDDELDDEF